MHCQGLATFKDFCSIFLGAGVGGGGGLLSPEQLGGHQSYRAVARFRPAHMGRVPNSLIPYTPGAQKADGTIAQGSGYPLTIGPSDNWAFGLSGPRIFGRSDYWVPEYIWPSVYGAS